MRKNIVWFLVLFLVLDKSIAITPLTPLFINPTKIVEAIKNAKNAQNEMLDRWGKDLDSLSDKYNQDSEKYDPLTRSVIASFEVLTKKKDLGSKDFSETLALLPDLKKHIESIKKALEEKGAVKEELTISRVLDLVKLKANELKPEEKTQLLTLLQYYIEKEDKDRDNTNSPALTILLRQLKAYGPTIPPGPVNLPADLMKALSLDPKKATLKEVLEKLKDKKAVLNDAETLKWAASISQKLNSNVESMGDAQLPIAEILFNLNDGRRFYPKATAFEDARTNLREILAKKFVPQGTLGEKYYVQPPKSDGSEDIAGRVERGASELPPGRMVPKFDDNDDAEACIKEKRKPKNRFNTELQLPGAGCGASVVASNPEKTRGDFIGAVGKNKESTCKIIISTARHCVVGSHFPGGKEIGIKIKGAFKKAKVESVISVDGQHGQPVANGNSDLSLLTATLPCAEAQDIKMARIPTQTEFEELTKPGIPPKPIVLEQNDPINARITGADGKPTHNQASIVAMATFDNFEGKLGNYAAFNSHNATYNKADDGFPDKNRWQGGKTIFNSPRIKSGDSGSFVGYCLFDDKTKKVKEIVYLGAVSHIEVLNNDTEGFKGGVSSGKSLEALIARVKHIERFDSQVSIPFDRAVARAASEEDHGPSSKGRPAADAKPPASLF